LLLAVAATIVIALGGLRGGLLLVVLAALPDLLDGALAKASNNASQRAPLQSERFRPCGRW